MILYQILETTHNKVHFNSNKYNNNNILIFNKIISVINWGVFY